MTRDERFGDPPSGDPLSVEWIDADRGFVVSGGVRLPFSVAVEGQKVWVRWKKRTYLVRQREGRPGGPGSSSVEPSETKAPIPGVVLSVAVRPGDQVARGTLLLTLEAMKMEHEIRATREARVKEVFVVPGERVDSGSDLLDLEVLEG